MPTTLADHLASLDATTLAGVLLVRPDACAHPVPGDLSRLADRLCGRSSLARVLPRLDLDTLQVGRALAVLGERAGVAAVADLLGADVDLVRRPTGLLVDQGLAWPDGDTLRLPDALAEHWRAEIGGHEPIARLARTVLVDELRRVAEAHGLAAAGLRKAEITQALHDAWTTPAHLAAVVAGLPAPERAHLARLAEAGIVPHTAGSRRLLDAGLLVRIQGAVAVPREVAVAVWRHEARLTGTPSLPPPADGGRRDARSAEAAAQEWLRTVVSVLDDAGGHPIAMLSGGGVGKRERARLVKTLDLPDDATSCLVIDLATAAGLLAADGQSYRPTPAYPAWREQDAARRWATLATAWFDLEHSPTFRTADEKEVPPPRPLSNTDGWVRRALLTAAGTASVTAAANHVGWFCPSHGCPDAILGQVLAAARGEAERLGVVVGDAVSDLGRILVDVAGVAGVADAAATHLADAPGDVVLQSDLTALVSGHPSARVTRLLDDAADTEARGAATTYRFSPASVRVAFDRGWDADGLLGALAEVSARPVPQPLEYLVRDVARRYGEVRVRPVACCLVVDATLADELVHARALRGLELTRLAPTVLATSTAPEKAIASLRAAGYFPAREDASGAVVIERPGPSSVTPAPSSSSKKARGSRGSRPRRPAAPVVEETPMAADELAARLLSAGVGTAVSSATARELAELNPRLDAAELDLLAHAVDHGSPVAIGYRDSNGTITQRTITPVALVHRWLVAWCHLRRDERDFTVASIRHVAPAR